MDLLAPLNPVEDSVTAEEPTAPLGMDLLAPPTPVEDTPVAEESSVDPLLAPVAVAEENAVQVGEIAGATIRSVLKLTKFQVTNLKERFMKLKQRQLSPAMVLLLNKKSKAHLL